MSARPWHWRRNNGYAVDDNNRTVVASACGRLVDYQEAVGDATEADCDECKALYDLIEGAFSPQTSKTSNQKSPPPGTVRG